jgi:tetratricopeptide (TPR) repeat protein
MRLPRFGWAPLVASLVLPLLLHSSALAAAGQEMPLTTTSKEARAAFEQGRDHFANGETVLAAPLFEKAIKADEKFALAHAYRSASGGGFELRRKFADRAGELAGAASPGEQALIQAFRAWLVADLAAAGAAFDNLLKLHPDDKWAQLQVGVWYQLNADWARATPHFERAAQLDPNFAAAQNSLGYARMTAGDLPGAEKALRRYVELRPREPNAHDSLAELLMKMGKFDDSIAAYKKALELDPTFTSSWEGIGNCQTLRDRFAEARDAYARAGSAAPDLDGKVRARYWRTVSYVHQGRTGEALASLEETRHFADQSGAPGAAIWTHVQANWILVEAGLTGAGAAQLDAAAAGAADPALPPTVRTAFEVAIQRHRVMTLAAIHEFDAARALAQKNRAAAEASKNVGAQQWLAGVLAWTELEAGKPEAALQQTPKAVRDSAWTLYLEALAKERKGDAAGAKQGFTALAHWNQNDLDYALVRARALAKAGAAQ